MDRRRSHWLDTHIHTLVTHAIKAHAIEAHFVGFGLGLGWSKVGTGKEGGKSDANLHKLEGHADQGHRCHDAPELKPEESPPSESLKAILSRSRSRSRSSVFEGHWRVH